MRKEMERGNLCVVMVLVVPNAFVFNIYCTWMGWDGMDARSLL